MDFLVEFLLIFALVIAVILLLAHIVILFMMAPWAGGGLVAVILISVLITVWVRRH
jgi:hypothetical protein